LLGMKVTSDPPTLASKNASVRVPPAVEAIVRRLLDKEASQRYQDAREVLDGIDACRMATAQTEHNLAAIPTPLGMPGSARYRASLAAVPRTAIDLSPLSGRLAEKRAQLMAWVTGLRDNLPGPLSQVHPLALLAASGLLALILLMLTIA